MEVKLGVKRLDACTWTTTTAEDEFVAEKLNGEMCFDDPAEVEVGAEICKKNAF